MKKKDREGNMNENTTARTKSTNKETEREAANGHNGLHKR